MSDVSYAVLTRAKAKYGKRLKAKDYKSLVECETVAEVMSYLKANTHYSNAFGEANERDIHRGVFESLLRQHLNFEFDTISRYDLSSGEYFSDFIANKTEIDEIIRFLTLLNSKNKSKKEFNFIIPAHLEKRTSINLSLLTNATTYEEFLTAIKNTPYETALKEFHLEYETQIPIAEIEDKLYTQLYKNLFNSIKLTHGDENNELHQLYDTIVDIENFTRILRLKKYYHSEPAMIKKHLLPFGTLTEKQIDNMCNADSSKNIFSAMRKTKYGKIVDKIKYTYASEIISAVKFKKTQHYMYFSDNPTTVMMSFIILSELEVLNLVTIIEGVRYGVDKDKITAMLHY